MRGRIVPTLIHLDVFPFLFFFGVQSDPTALPLPDHVLLNHLYALSIKVRVQHSFELLSCFILSFQQFVFFVLVLELFMTALNVIPCTVGLCCVCE